MKMQAGRYKQRNGEIKDIAKTDNQIWQWREVGRSKEWDKHGSYRGDDLEHPFDLVERMENIQLSVGTWKDRNGKEWEVKPIAMWDNSEWPWYGQNNGKWRRWGDDGLRYLDGARSNCDLVEKVSSNEPVLGAGQNMPVDTAESERIIAGLAQYENAVTRLVLNVVDKQGGFYPAIKQWDADRETSINPNIAIEFIKQLVKDSENSTPLRDDGPTITDTHITIPISQLNIPKDYRIKDIRSVNETNLFVDRKGQVMFAMGDYAGPLVIVEKIEPPKPLERWMVLDKNEVVIESFGIELTKRAEQYDNDDDYRVVKMVQEL